MPRRLSYLSRVPLPSCASDSPVSVASTPKSLRRSRSFAGIDRPLIGYREKESFLERSLMGYLQTMVYWFTHNPLSATAVFFLRGRCGGDTVHARL